MKTKTFILSEILLLVLITACQKNSNPVPQNNPKLTNLDLSLAASNATVAKKSITSGLVGYYPFLGNANDATSYGNDGTLQNFSLDAPPNAGLPSLTNDKYGYPNSAYSFNGVSDYITFNHNSLLVGATDTSIYPFGKVVTQFSVYTRFKSDTNGTIQTLVQCGDAHAGANSAALTINADQSLSFNWGFAYPPSFAGSATITTAAQTIQPSKWYDVVLNFSNSQLTIYVNGHLQGTQTTSFATGGFYDNFRFGTTLGSFPGDFFKGVLDNVGLYNRPLSRNEIEYLLHTRKLK